MRSSIAPTQSPASTPEIDAIDSATQALLCVEKEKFRELLAWLDAPAPLNPGLQSLMALKSPWDKSLD